MGGGDVVCDWQVLETVRVWGPRKLLEMGKCFPFGVEEKRVQLLRKWKLEWKGGEGAGVRTSGTLRATCFLGWWWYYFCLCLPLGPKGKSGFGFGNLSQWYEYVFKKVTIIVRSVSIDWVNPIELLLVLTKTFWLFS